AEPPLLLESLRIVQRALVREDPLLHAAHEEPVELESLRRVHRHELHAVLVRPRLHVARLERGVGQELDERRHLGILADERIPRGIDERPEALDALLAAAVRLLAGMRDSARAAV